MHITLRHLRTFEAVARHGSTFRAAGALHLTQPAVSMQMKQLEEQIGLPLVELVGRRICLTEAGQVLRVHANEIAARMAHLNASMEQFQGLERGESPRYRQICRLVRARLEGPSSLDLIHGCFTPAAHSQKWGVL